MSIESAVRDLLKLEEECFQCYGEGTVEPGNARVIHAMDQPTTCGICMGRGGHLTELGRSVIELVRKYGAGKEGGAE